MTRSVSQASGRNFRIPRRLCKVYNSAKVRIPSLLSEQPSETPGHSLVNNIKNDAFNQGFSQFSNVFFRDMFLEDFLLISRQCSQIPCIRPDYVVFRPDTHQSSNIRPDDVIHRPDAQLSKASFVRTTRTFRLDLPLDKVASL
jgi:hypothetical protein